MLTMKNLVTYHRFKHLMFSEYLCSKIVTKPVFNRKAAAQTLPQEYYKECRAERIFSIISAS